MIKRSLKPSKELEQEIMEYIFSNKCPDHRAALAIWENNPWIAVSMYEVEHHPENLGYPLCFPKEVEVPKWYMRKLENEELLAMEGKPIHVPYPRSSSMTIEENGLSIEVNKFGRLILNNDEQEGTD